MSKWICGVSSKIPLAPHPNPNEPWKHYNQYLNNYKSEGWPWASFPSFPTSTGDVACREEKDPSLRSWPPPCDINQLPRAPAEDQSSSPCTHLAQVGFTGGGLLFEVQGSTVYGMRGKKTWDSSFMEPSFLWELNLSGKGGITALLK